jgi:hypothetical protein
MKRLLLFVSLLSALAQAMETAVIKDVHGQEFTLNQAQKNALGQCKTLKSMLLDCGNAQQIDFEGLAALVFKDAVFQLAQCIENPKDIDRIPDDKIVDLFKLADYLHAPKDMATTLAERVERVINARLAKLHNLENWDAAQEAEYADLKALEQSIQKHLGISMNKWLENNFPKPTPEGFFTLDLSCKPETKTRNKVRRLNGIEKIENRNLVAGLNLDNHDISTIDLAFLDRVFPRLTQLSVKNNRIEKIYEKSPLRAIVVNLEGNPLNSITIENPERSNYLTFKTDNPGVKVDFVQSKWAKGLTWFKSLNAKTKATLEYLLPPRDTLIVPILAGALWGYMNHCHENELRDLLKKIPHQDVAVLDGTIFNLNEEATDITKWYFIAAFLYKLCKFRGIQALVDHSKVMPLDVAFAKCQIPSQFGYMHTLLSYGTCVTKAALVYAAVEAGLGGISSLTGLCNVSLTDYLQRIKVRGNPYRIKIQNGDASIKEFPSNYTYNLFGKF